MTRPRLLDLYCGAGGASMGYHRAGFDVTGVDMKAQPRYPFTFVQGDALDYLRDHGQDFDAIAASPPCQAYSATRTMWNARPDDHPDLLGVTREALIATGKPYAIENVPGADMPSAIVLCGTMFGLGYQDADLRRHRLFEASVMLMLPGPCRHGRRGVVGVYGGHVRDRRRTIGIYGEGARDATRRTIGVYGGGDRDRSVGSREDRGEFDVDAAKEAMGIDWMTLAELCQAIPPIYAQWVGRQMLAAMSYDDDAASDSSLAASRGD